MESEIVNVVTNTCSRTYEKVIKGRYNTLTCISPALGFIILFDVRDDVITPGIPMSVPARKLPRDIVGLILRVPVPLPPFCPWVYTWANDSTQMKNVKYDLTQIKLTLDFGILSCFR